MFFRPTVYPTQKKRVFALFPKTIHDKDNILGTIWLGWYEVQHTSCDRVVRNIPDSNYLYEDHLQEGDF